MSYRLFALVFALALVADSFVGASLEATFSAEGARIDVAGREVSMFVAAIGRDGAPLSLVRREPEIDGAEARTEIGAGIVEWWRSLAAGLEHGVTIDTRPAGGGPLRIEVQASGLTPRLRSEDEVEFVADGAVRMTYAHLVTLDADGARVPGHMEVANGRVVLSIDDDRARYPLVIDPLVLVEEATLRAPAPTMSERLGGSLGMSADGTRVITSGNSARVFLRTGTSWALEATLPPGAAVAISPDGTRAIVARSTTTVHVRTGTTWTMEATLAASNVVAIAMDRDGTRAIVGRGTSGYRIYGRSGTSWSMQYDASSDPPNVTAVAMARDGSRAFAGQPDENSNRSGHVVERVRIGSSWTLGQVLTDQNPATDDDFGASLAISADGSRLVVGVPGDDDGTGGRAGRAVVFLRGTMWTREASIVLAGFGFLAAVRDEAGTGVGISGDGSRIVMGAPGVSTDRGSVTAFRRSGTGWSRDATFAPADVSNSDRFGSSIAMADTERLVTASAGDDIGSITDAGTAYVLIIGSGPGTSCGGDIECASGFCTDGVCCGARCDGDCESCSAAGACVPAPATTECRASAGGCDPVEFCTGASGTCPVDVRSPLDTVCRPAAEGCDVAATCDGTSAACPANGRLPIGTECRAATGLCDRPELCDGTSAACPALGATGVLVSGASCRPSTGLCDVPEVCDGTSTICPGDVLFAANTSCGAVPGSCASAGICNGTFGACIGATALAAGTPCLFASAANPCDLDDLCDGASLLCPATFAPATTVCNDLLTGVCDAPDFCTGTSADCMPTFLSGTECRSASTPCDNAEVCSGSSPVCPPDLVAAAGLSCRVSVDSTCDPVEVCDGVAASCPADENTCLDAGPRDGGVADAGPPDAATGCGCRATRGGPSALAILGFAALFVRRRTSRISLRRS